MSSAVPERHSRRRFIGLSATGLLALVANALPYLLFAIGEQTVSSSLAGALNATTPLWTLGIGLAARTERQVTTLRVVGLLVGFAGALVILAPWNAPSAGTIGGALACLGAAASYGLSYVYMGRRLAGRGLSPLVLSAAQLTAATGLLLVVTPLAGRFRRDRRLGTGRIRSERLRSDRHRRAHHVDHESSRNGTGHVHLHADAHRRRA